ncbi:hypothetical protein [Pseudomonas sp. MPB26]|uniref:hypothetical protein n=1 Tax=Pseudomonas sp. MPB26 TaxID=3388491 RepID=UPI003984F689
MPKITSFKPYSAPLNVGGNNKPVPKPLNNHHYATSHNVGGSGPHQAPQKPVKGQKPISQGQSTSVSANGGSSSPAQPELYNKHGRRIDAQGNHVDKTGARVNKEGYRIDDSGRLLNKDGKVARSKQSAALGDNEPHKDIGGTKKPLGNTADWGATPAPVSLKTPEQVARNSNDVLRLAESGVIQPKSSAARTARDAAITALAGGVVAIPTNAASSAATTSTTEAIKAKYVPQPLASTSASATDSPEQQVLKARMDTAQDRIFLATNEALILRFGHSKNELVPGEGWSSDPVKRMTQLEDMLDEAEEHTGVLAQQHRAFFNRYLPETEPVEGSAGLPARIEILEKRLAEVQTAQEKVVGNIKNTLGSSSVKN